MLVGMAYERLARRAVLVDMGHAETVDVEAHAQVIGAQDAVQVGNGSEVLGRQPAVKGVEPLNTVILVLQVGLHESNVLWHVLEQRTRVWAAKHGYPHVGILPGQ